MSASFVVLEVLVARQMADEVCRRSAAPLATFGLVSCGWDTCFTDTFLTFAHFRPRESAAVCGVQVSTSYVLLYEATARTRRTLYCLYCFLDT